MKYKGTYFDMWDTWYLNDNGRVHGFHLKSHPGANWNVGHVYTDDLLHFKKMRDVLETLPEEQYPDDCLGKFTGCAVKKDGKYYVFYTMRDRYHSQKIGLAISEDAEHFEEYSGNPVLTPDENIFIVRQKGELTDCRDMHVVYDSKTSRYYGYFAAMADIENRSEIGVVGVAESYDLIHWENQQIVYIPDFNGIVEVPNVFELNGKWYMTLLTGAWYGGKGACSEKSLNCVTISAISDSPCGPFECTDDNIFLGGVTNSGYACKCVEYNGKIYAMYIDRSEYGSAISLPKEIKQIGGDIKPCYTDILKKLHISERNSFDFSALSPAWAWKTVCAGSIASENDTAEIKTLPRSLQAFKIDGISVKSLEAEFILSGDFKEAGFLLLCSDGNEIWGQYAANEYYISVNREENLLVLYGSRFEELYRRKFDFAAKNSSHMRIIAMEGQLEVYIDNVLYMQCGIKTGKLISGGLWAFSGCAEFKNIKLFELEG